MSVPPAFILGWSIVLGYGVSASVFIFGLEHNAGILISGLGIVFLGALLTLLVAATFYYAVQAVEVAKRPATTSETDETAQVPASQMDPLVIEMALKNLSNIEIDVMWRKLYGYTYQEIKEDLKINENSILLLEKNISRKMDVGSFDELFNIFLILGYFGKAPALIEKQRSAIMGSQLTEANFLRTGHIS